MPPKKYSVRDLMALLPQPDNAGTQEAIDAAITLGIAERAGLVKKGNVETSKDHGFADMPD